MKKRLRRQSRKSAKTWLRKLEKNLGN